MVRSVSAMMSLSVLVMRTTFTYFCSSRMASFVSGNGCHLPIELAKDSISLRHRESEPYLAPCAMYHSRLDDRDDTAPEYIRTESLPICVVAHADSYPRYYARLIVQQKIAGLRLPSQSRYHSSQM